MHHAGCTEESRAPLLPTSYRGRSRLTFSTHSKSVEWKNASLVFALLSLSCGLGKNSSRPATPTIPGRYWVLEFTCPRSISQHPFSPLDASRPPIDAPQARSARVLGISLSMSSTEGLWSMPDEGSLAGASANLLEMLAVLEHAAAWPCVSPKAAVSNIPAPRSAGSGLALHRLPHTATRAQQGSCCMQAQKLADETYRHCCGPARGPASPGRTPGRQRAPPASGPAKAGSSGTRIRPQSPTQSSACLQRQQRASHELADRVIVRA